MVDLKTTEQIKAYARQVANALPERLLKGDKHTHKARARVLHSDTAYIEQSYNQLEGEWQEWLEIARKYERKVPSQDRYDIRHTILLELNKARQRDGEPLPQLRAYRKVRLERDRADRRQKKEEETTARETEQPALFAFK